MKTALLFIGGLALAACLVAPVSKPAPLPTPAPAATLPPDVARFVDTELGIVCYKWGEAAPVCLPTPNK